MLYAENIVAESALLGQNTKKIIYIKNNHLW